MAMGTGGLPIGEGYGGHRVPRGVREQGPVSCGLRQKS